MASNTEYTPNKNGYGLLSSTNPVVSLVDVAYMTSSSSTVATKPTPRKETPIKIRRKSVKGDTVAFRKERRLKNMNINEEKVSPLPDCPSKCNLKSAKEERQLVWEDFRRITSNNQRYRYLAQLIRITIPKRCVTPKPNRKQNRERTIKYYLKTATNMDENDENLLCKRCFMKIFRVTASKVRTIAQKKQQNGQQPGIQYNRASHVPKSKVLNSEKEEASLFLLSVPAYESHYGRSDSSKKYLPDFHTKTSLFEDFKAAYPKNRVNYKQFVSIFRELDLSIKTRACDTCKTCDSLKIRVDTAGSEEIRKLVIQEQEAHWAKWKSAVQEKKRDAQLSVINPSVKVIAYDLEQILPTPSLTTSVAFYMRQLSTFNLTIFDLGTKESDHNVWHEGMADRGSNEINSCIFKYAMNLPSTVTHLIKYSDRCFGQNLNITSIVADMYLLQESASLQVIDSKFLISGHTHMECDNAHAIIERYKKRYPRNIEVPDDWVQLIKQASPQFHVNKLTSADFLNFTENLSEKLVYRKVDTKKEPWKFENVYWVRVEKDRPYIFKYKSSFDEKEPFKEVSLLRKNIKGKLFNLIAQQKHESDNANPVKMEKKRDLLQLLKYIKPENRKFYEDLKASED